jgi:hypothetical protein
VKACQLVHLMSPLVQVESVLEVQKLVILYLDLYSNVHGIQILRVPKIDLCKHVRNQCRVARHKIVRILEVKDHRWMDTQWHIGPGRKEMVDHQGIYCLVGLEQT